MTKKLYYENSHLSEFCSEVKSITTINGKNAVILSSTAFFPTGGGQPCDTGKIAETVISQTEESDGIIYHFFEGEPSFSVDDEVFCVIDYPQRFARMQAHSGEHIVSGMAHNLFGVENVGFHMDGLLMTVDFDKPLTVSQIRKVEEKANEAIYHDVSVHAETYTAEEAAGQRYRSKKEFIDNVRIVTIEGIDRCACCAPHVSHTGEIGLVKILSCVSHRGGVRITLICGKEAYRDYVCKYDQTLRIAALLAAKHSETDLAVLSLIEQNKELKYAVYEQKKRLCAYIVSQSASVDGNAVVFADNCDLDELCEISIGMQKKCGGVSVACSGNDSDGYSYAVTCPGVEMNRFVKQINGALNGRGGGRDELIRGRFQTTKAEIKRFFDTFGVKRP